MVNQRGNVLAMTLLILLVLSSLVAALLAIAGHESTISKNLTEGTQARFAAEAGLEAAFDILAVTGNWSTLLANAAAQNGLMFNNHAIGSLPTSQGTYTVALRNDTLAGDPAITGVAADGGGPITDTNKVVIVTSAGTTSQGTRRVRAVFRKLLNFPPNFFPGAVNFPGREAETMFTGTSFSIDGRGYKMDGTRDASCASNYGIAVSSVLGSPPGSNEAVVENSLTAAQKSNVWGKSQTGGVDTSGNNTIAATSTLSPTMVKNFIDQAKASADIVLNSDQPLGLSMSNIGSTCATDPKSQTCWGHKDASTGEIVPKIVYIKGSPDPTSLFTALAINGNSAGYGVLIVEDGDLKIFGSFNWNGAVIVTGSYIGLGFMGGGTQVVNGAVISNETATDPGFKEGLLSGSAEIRNSCEALTTALGNNRRLTSIATWKELAPGE